jgi:hypothetical protein
MNVSPLMDITARRTRYKPHSPSSVGVTTELLESDNRVIIKLEPTPTDDNFAYENRQNGGFTHSVRAAFSPILAMFEHEYYPCFPSNGTDPHCIQVENDPINALRATAPTTQEEALLETKERIGNIRSGPKRFIMHMGGTLNARQINDLDGSGITAFPLFPPVVTDPADPEITFLRTMPGGYKHYIKGNPVGVTTASLLEAKEATGFKHVIWDGTDAALIKSSDTVEDSIGLKIKDVETLVNASYSGKTPPAPHNTFLPAEKAWQIVNIPATAEIRVDPTDGISLIKHSADFSSILAQIQIKMDGTVVVDVSGGGLPVEITGDVKVVGTLDVSVS